MDTDGTMVVLAKVPEPYAKYIKAYSDNCVAIRIPEKSFFYFLDYIPTTAISKSPLRTKPILNTPLPLLLDEIQNV